MNISNQVDASQTVDMTDTQQPSEQLSERECEILELVATGATNRQVAQALGISVNTVKAHLRRVFAKLGAESRTEATTMAMRLGVIKMPVPAEGEAGEAAAAEAGVTGPDAVVSDRPLPWRLAAGQMVILAVVILGAFALAIWPAPRAEQAASPSRFVDLPANGDAVGDEDLDGRWTTGANMPTERARFAQVLVGNGIYVIGGLSVNGFTDVVERYDVASDQWATLASKPTMVANIGAVVLDGRIYVPGGYLESDQATNVVEVYDIERDTWSEGAPLPTPLFAYAAAAWGDGFYLFGGHDGSEYVDTILFYDGVSDVWSEAGTLPSARAFSDAVTVGDEIYLIGGYDGRQELATCDVYSPGVATSGGDPWTSRVPISVGRAGHSAVTAGDYVYIVGGGWDGYHLSNERYDLQHDIWSAFPSPVVGEWRTLGLSVAEAYDGTRLYAVGGWSGRPLGLVRVYQAEYRVYLPRQ